MAAPHGGTAVGFDPQSLSRKATGVPGGLEIKSDRYRYFKMQRSSKHKAIRIAALASIIIAIILIIVIIVIIVITIVIIIVVIVVIVVVVIIIIIIIFIVVVVVIFKRSVSLLFDCPGLVRKRNPHPPLST